MLKTPSIFLNKTLTQYIKMGSNHYLPSYRMDILTIGILVTFFSFIITMFLGATLFRNTSNPQSTTHIITAPLLSEQLPQDIYQQSHTLSSQDNQDEQGVQAPQNLILTAVVEDEQEQESAEPTDPPENNVEPEDSSIAFKGQRYRVRRTMNVTHTAYSSTPDQTDSTPFITASNTRVRWGTVAANFLPFQTKIRIPQLFGDKVFVVEDRMNKRYWHRVDVWMPTRQEAINFGLRTLRIEILEPVPATQTM